jgi:acyl carrier protein
MSHSEKYVRAAMESLLGREIPDLRPDLRLFEDLGLDSTSLLVLLMNLEDNGDIEIDPDELTSEVFADVGSLTRYVEECLTRASQS